MHTHDIVICGRSTLHHFSTSHKQRDFLGEGWALLNVKCVFLFSLQLLSETFFIPRGIERDMINKVCCCLCKICYSCDILMKIEFSYQFFEKSSIIKYHENP
jgi:hypothetical protein